MLRNDPFYFASLQDYTTLFGTLFNEIYIQRTDAANNVVSFMKVPLTYAPKDKILARYREDPNIDKPSEITLPIMAFEHGSPVYRPNDHLKATGRIVKLDSTDGNKMKTVFNPVPYDIPFSLYVFVKNVSDGNKIVEQILPFFTPDWTVTARFLSPLNLDMDIPIVHSGTAILQDTYDGSLKERRAIIWTLNFVVKGYFWGPVKGKPIIKMTNINKYIMGSNNVVEYQQVTPGLTANGEPTGNASLSVNSNLIFANSDFGYIVTESGGPLV